MQVFDGRSDFERIFGMDYGPPSCGVRNDIGQFCPAATPCRTRSDRRSQENGHLARRFGSMVHLLCRSIAVAVDARPNPKPKFSKETDA